MSNPSAKFASSFAPYTPPPDDPSYASSSRPEARPWFPPQNTTSYQSGGIPTFNTSQAGGIGAVEDAEAESGSSAWETTYHMKVDALAAFAYIFGPFSGTPSVYTSSVTVIVPNPVSPALALLIFERHNDYVRFHAYQSALLSTPLVLLRILVSLLGFPSWLRTVLTFLLVAPLLYMTWRAFVDASRHGLARFHLPRIGPVADRWVSEE
ncbi:hypothetical protein EIP91_008900 [Steccherinum ochraceum]|uniref:Uncharacterized protein n=1 Tax=Steccherinum ochraceum TaxID=92696 RepID=A0A4R0RYV9_9APHY|nr:hypothetical protein EIP91_008900 [Steccherinum ochraceum]